MGKDSLIKSTSKKKSTSSKKDDDSAKVMDKKAKAAKKTATKAKKSTKTAPKKTKSTVKGKSASTTKAKAPKKSKTTAKTKTAPKSKTVAAKKAADQKAAAEKAAAEKAAAEKAAAEKVAAEKAAAEKVAAEKAEAERAAAKRAAQEPKPSISYSPPPDAAKPVDSSNRPIQIAAGVFALLIFLIVSASYMNKKQYHIKPANGAIEVWQGNFAPKGTSLLVSLPGEKLKAPAKEVYSRQEVYPLIFNYYKEKAITLMDVKGMPDFETVQFYLEQALCYSTTSKEKADVKGRISSIDFMVLMSKADAAMSKKTVASFETALQHLGQAAKLDLEDFQETQIKKKAEYAKQTLDQLKQEEAAAKAAAQKAKKAAAAKKKDGAPKEAAKPKDVKTENAH